MKYPFGAGRLALGLIGLFGSAGAIEQSHSITLSLLPAPLLSLALASWGLARSEHGPLLPVLVREWEGRVSRRARRRRVINQRARGA
ncbi:hypothetical protein Q0M94_28470 (plasmid) [Deinococcus radiomollis]|uniref:hypothetical protein n=1 Tax=Deinococcus radiomollis TaxID=468916 RepID=UPI0038917051